MHEKNIMSVAQESQRLEIPLSVVEDLLSEQFPAWAHFPIKSLEKSGWDNRTFRLGGDMSIRLPSAAEYALQVPKEHQWLPLLAPHLSLSIPEPLALGHPSKDYPWHWSIYRWIEGESLRILDFLGNCSRDFEGLPMERFAVGLAQFLKELHGVDVQGGPIAGPHNYYRGASPAVYDDQTRSALLQLQGLVDIHAAYSVWEAAIRTVWDRDPVWVHGDLSADNILVNNGRLVAIIDFGCMGIGDPSCDLVIAWTFLTAEGRKIFRAALGLDPKTWARARGWALWKALITLASLKDKDEADARAQRRIITEILHDHMVENPL